MPDAQLRPLLITPGEPAGIGPDLVIQLAQQALSHRWLVVADPSLLQERAEQLGQRIDIRRVESTQLDALPPCRAGQLYCLPVTLQQPVTPGRADPGNARYVLNTLDIALDCCLQGLAHALVTGPVNKAAINDAGIVFSGHTEYLAARCDAGEPLMMLATPGLRVALATTHLPLREVPDAITQPRLEYLLATLHQALQTQFGIARPRILVAGLNPHAGEQGHLGHEEIEVIGPVVEKLRNAGINLIGPLPADTLFTPQHLADADAVMAMYHDQGLPVLKYKGFSKAVNITLGLPVVRTSVDHGTALDLAGSGRADAGSLRYALSTAAAMHSPVASA